jgi:hypothetical protein
MSTDAKTEITIEERLLNLEKRVSKLEEEKERMLPREFTPKDSLQKIPQIELYKKIQERSCTLVIVTHPGIRETGPLNFYNESCRPIQDQDDLVAAQTIYVTNQPRQFVNFIDVGDVLFRIPKVDVSPIKETTLSSITLIYRSHSLTRTINDSPSLFTIAQSPSPIAAIIN